MPDTYAAEIESLPLASHLILWLSAAFVFIAIIWANFATLDEVAHAEGRVIPSGQIQVVQNLEGGILSEVNISAGDFVNAGQILLLLDDTRFASSFREGTLSVHTLRARVARLEAEIDEIPFTSIPGFSEEHQSILDDEILLYTSRQQELESSISILRQQRTQYEQGLAELRAAKNKLTSNAALEKKELEITAP